MANLHSQQIALLNLLRDNIDNPLSLSELQIALDMSSRSVVQHHIQQLEKKGYLKRNPSNPRDYKILIDPEKPISFLNLYGLAQCGPDGQFLEDNPIERIPVSIRLLKFPASEALLVKAEGQSMVPYIHQGDLVIIQQRNNAANDDIILCMNEGKAMIKKFCLDKNNILLSSINPDPKYKPFIASDGFLIAGIVRGVLKYN